MLMKSALYMLDKLPYSFSMTTLITRQKISICMCLDELNIDSEKYTTDVSICI